MHGIHIAQDIVEQARKQGKVKSIEVEVGELANITKEDLAKHLENITDFPFQITEADAEVECGCGYKGKPKIIERQHDIVLFTCPECGELPKVISGDKIILKSVVVE